ncbi:hypothetical protein [Pararhodobacter sp.]|uniref:hypothetical protein n=1 Tax=Pararhodobacter sp. TaxID=2127056 RepID=UPI002FDE5314
MQILADGIKLFSGPDFTADTLRQLGLIVQDLRSGRVTRSQAVAAAEKISPSLGKDFREWANLGINFVIAMASVASAVFVWLQTPGQNRTVDEIAIDAFESIYQEPQPVLSKAPRISGLSNSADQRSTQQANRKARRTEKAQSRKAKKP